MAARSVTAGDAIYSHERSVRVFLEDVSRLARDLDDLRWHRAAFEFRGVQLLTPDTETKR